MPDLPLQMPAVPEGFCNSLSGPDWVQTFLNLIAQGVAKMQGSDFSVIITSETVPGPENAANLWRRPSTGLIYHYAGGVWIVPHLEQDGFARRWFTGTVTPGGDLETYDGGSAGAVAANSGPMWEVDPDFAAKFPIPPGTLTSGVAITANIDGGAETKTIADDNLPEHTHSMDGYLAHVPTTTPGEPRYTFGGPLGGVNVSANVGQSNINTTAKTGLNVMPPYRGCSLIMRTTRVNYVGS